MFVRQIYMNAVTGGKKPPLITVMPSYWHGGVNSAAILYRDGKILGRQKKYTQYIILNPVLPKESNWKR